MICKNCGAKLEKDMPLCPYCGADNFQNSLLEHENRLNEWRNKFIFWKNMPERTAKKARMIALIALVAFLVIAGIVAIVGVIYSKVESKKNFEEEIEAASELEALYQAGDYEGLAARFEEYDLESDALLVKYNEVYQMNSIYYLAKSSMEEDIAFAKEHKQAICMYSQVGWFKLLRCCDEFEKTGYVYEEEEAVAYYRQEAMQVLQEEFHFTELDIQVLLEEYLQIEDYEDREKYEEKLQKVLCDALNQGE